MNTSYWLLNRGQAQRGTHNNNNAAVSNHVHSSLLHSASAVKLNYTHIMAETNADYQFTQSDIWVMDSRMTAFAADLKTSNWASVDEAPDLLVLKLNHLFFDDEADENTLRDASGKEKHVNWIFLRPDARDVWDHIYSRLLDKPETRVGGGRPPPSQAFLTVSGNSGIGKSYSIIYVLKKFLSENRVVFYDFRNETKLYAFIPEKDGGYHVYRTSVFNFKDAYAGLLWKHPGTVLPPVLWDPAAGDDKNFKASYMSSCRTAAAVSIQKDLVTNAYKDFDVEDRYMMQWSLEHLETVRQVCYQDVLTLEELRYRYFRYGGIFRLMFAPTHILEEFDTQFINLIDCLTQRDLECILGGGIVGKFETISCGVFEVKPDPESPWLRKFDFGSPYVYALLAGRFWETLAKYSKGENPRYTEWFEAMAMLRLSEGGTFQVKKLGENSAGWEELELDRVRIEMFEPTNGKEVDNEGFYAAWARSQGGEMLAPSWGTLPVVDSADKSRRGYNMTVTMKHGIEYAPCKKILEVHDSFTGNTNNMTLYFAVPDLIADSVGKQSFDGVKKTENDNKNRISHRIDQYVLKIESVQIERLKDMFLSMEKKIEEEFVKKVEVTERFRKRKRSGSCTTATNSED